MNVAGLNINCNFLMRERFIDETGGEVEPAQIRSAKCLLGIWMLDGKS